MAGVAKPQDFLLYSTVLSGFCTDQHTFTPHVLEGVRLSGCMNAWVAERVGWQADTDSEDEGEEGEAEGGEVLVLRQCILSAGNAASMLIQLIRCCLPYLGPSVCGHVWSCVVMCGHVWSYVVMCGNMWSCVAAKAVAPVPH